MDAVQRRAIVDQIVQAMTVDPRPELQRVLVMPSSWALASPQRTVPVWTTRWWAEWHHPLWVLTVPSDALTEAQG